MRPGIHDAPIFATLPVYKFGQLVLYDFLQNMKMEAEQQDLFSFDDIDVAFRKAIPVKYNQTIKLHDQERARVGIYFSNRETTVQGIY